MLYGLRPVASLTSVGVGLFSIDIKNEKSFEKYNQVIVYNSLLNYSEIILSETSGDYIPRLSNTCEKRDELLVMSKFLTEIGKS